MLAERAIELCETDPDLWYLATKLRLNFSDECIESKGINPNELYIGRRTEDSGWVIGYRDGSNSILDIGLIALWWCACISPLSEEDFTKLKECKEGSTFQPISSKRY